jgi:AraC-like DNA-binding protein
MTAMVRAQAIRGYRQLVTDLGGNPNRLLRKAGVKASALDQPSAFISFVAMIRLLEQTATELDCPDFGFQLAEHQDIGILGPVAVAMRHSATVGDALACASKYLYVHNPAIGFAVCADGGSGEVRLVFEILADHQPHEAQMIEHGVGIATRILAMLAQGRSHLLGVWLPHSPAAPRALYRRHLGAPVTFQAETAAMAIARDDVDLALSERNQELHDLATNYLDLQFPRHQTPFRAQVRKAIDGLLGTGTCSYGEVADALAMHPRTLQRRLREEDTTFEEMKDEARRDMAQRYLSHPEVPLTQVSALLDYSEQSALVRSCRRWFQTTPRALRASLAARSPALAVS